MIRLRLAYKVDAALVVAGNLPTTRAERERAEALLAARRLVAEGRVCFTRREQLSQAPALRAARRLAFLLALAGAEPEELALLTRHEVDGLRGGAG